MKVPNGFTEIQVVELIKKVSSRLAFKFRFGYNDINDIKQEAALIAIESLDSYDGIRPLENFLYACIHNRLYNLKRNKFQRPDKPCHTCPFYDKKYIKSDNQCTEYIDKNNCELYNNWILRNTAKKNIMQPIDIDNIRDEKENNMSVGDHVNNIEHNELLQLIDRHLDINLRADYIKIKNGIKIPKKRREIVEKSILKIVKKYYEPAETR